MLLEFQNLPQTILFVKFHRKCDYLPVNLICKIVFGLIVINVNWCQRPTLTNGGSGFASSNGKKSSLILVGRGNREI